MSDDALSPDHELANAYLDGHADAHERATVEASPELLALVASYQALRARVAGVPPPSSARRDAAVAAALAAMPAVVPPSNVVSLDRRRRSRVLTAAAAVVLLGVAGVAVSKAVTGSESASTARGGDAIGQSIADNKLAPAANSITESDTAGAAAQITAIGGAASGVPAVNTEAELAALAPSADVVVPNFVFDCELAATQRIEAEITWQGSPAVAVRDTVSGVISVVSPDCTELVVVQPQP
jgi:hypothetical protein